MIYIVRHGQTDRNLAGVLQGRINSELNATGTDQARATALYFRKAGIHFDLIYSSPLKRAMQTARIIAGEDANLITDDRLLEMDYGPYEGVSLLNPPEEIVEFFKDLVHNPAPQGMEQLSSIVERLGSFLESIAGQADKNILISTHAISMKGALEYLTPTSNGSYWSKYVGNCSVYQAEYTNGHFSVPFEIIKGDIGLPKDKLL